MHVIHPDPRRLLAALGATIVLIVATLGLPQAAGELDLRPGGGSSAGADTPADVRPAPAQPRWVADPFSPPALVR